MRRWVQHVGPVLIAFILGMFLVTSSLLSYRDARFAAQLLAERQGIALLFRLQATLRENARDSRALGVALEAHRSVGLAYIGVVQGGDVVVAVGEPLLSGAEPELGAPAFGHGRVRMVSPGAGRRTAAAMVPTPATAITVPAEKPASDDRAASHMFPLPPFLDRPLSFPRHDWQLVIEFTPLGHEGVIRRALVVLVLSSGTALLLAAAAVVIWISVRRAEIVSRRLVSQSHLAQLGEMSAVLAHEIRNPLAALKGHAQLLAERLSGQPVKARVDRVVNEAVRLEMLTNGLLRFAGSGTIQIAPTDPGEVLGRAVAATDPERIDQHVHAAATQWMMDGPRMEQVLVNLLDNALAVTATDRRVVAEVTMVNDQLTYSVRDHGPGVPVAERARIFDAFHTTKVRGTGLGLSVSKRIVDLHGGTISVEDAVGGGACFRVCIPRLKARAA